MAKKESQYVRSVYSGFDDTGRTTLSNEVIDGVGGLFGIGIVGGSLYHLGKNLLRTKSVTTAANAARVFGPRLGGNFALVSLAIDTPRVLYQLYYGVPAISPDKKADTLYALGVGTLAAAGGLMRVPWGLGSALRTAAVCGSVAAAGLSLPIINENMHVFIPQLLDSYYNTNYVYPHYRLHPHPQQHLQPKDGDGDNM